MDPDPPPVEGIAARVRWGNVARAVALLAIVALVVAWPRLRTPAPEVPAGAAVPVRQVPAPAAAPEPASPEPVTATTTAPAESPAATSTTDARTHERRRRPPKPRAARKKPATRPAPAPPPASLPPATVAPSPPSREFAIE